MRTGPRKEEVKWFVLDHKQSQVHPLLQLPIRKGGRGPQGKAGGVYLTGNICAEAFSPRGTYRADILSVGSSALSDPVAAAFWLRWDAFASGGAVESPECKMHVLIPKWKNRKPGGVGHWHPEWGCYTNTLH